MIKTGFNFINKFKLSYSTLIDGSCKKTNNTFLKRKEKTVDLLKKLNEIKIKFADGGGVKARNRHVHQNRKLLVTDRLNILFDKGQYMEICGFVGFGQTYGDIPKAGCITAIGKINDRLCLVSASDATVKGGAVYPIQLRKQLRLQSVSMSLHLPIIFVIDSAGAFLPLQAEIFPDKDHGGKQFYNEAALQSQGIPVLTLVCGSCTAGAAYIPTMSTETGMVLGIGHIFLGGPPLVKAALGEIISADDLGGADLHAKVSGCSDYTFSTETEGLQGMREIIKSLPQQHVGCKNIDNTVDPLFPTHELDGLLLNFENNEDDCKLTMLQILARILDGSYFHEFKSEYGFGLTTGFARISGFAVGVMACHNSLSEKDCLKGSNFIQICGHRDLPIISFVHSVEEACLSSTDPTADLNGSIVKAKSLMMRSMSTRNSKLITLVVGDAVGIDYICLGGRSMEPDFLFAWPNSRFGWNHSDLENVETGSAISNAGNMVVDDIIEPCNSRIILARFLEILHVQSNLLLRAQIQPVYRF